MDVNSLQNFHRQLVLRTDGIQSKCLNNQAKIDVNEEKNWFSSPDKHKFVYEYGTQKEKKKTPMCQISELARYNKLKHEYVLLDESGLAHKKRFTVKLVLAQGQEFEGVGPSIKKAQQMAAQNALLETTFSFPNNKSNKTRSKDYLSPLNLLKSFTEKFGITYRLEEETLFDANERLIYNPSVIPHDSSFLNIHTSVNPSSILCLHNQNGFDYNFYRCDSQFQLQRLNENCCFILPTHLIALPQSSLLNSPTCNNNYISTIMPKYSMNSNLNAKRFSTQQNDLAVQSIQMIKKHKVTIYLSIDESEHSAIDSNLHQSRMKAAKFALLHLNTKLEEIKHTIVLKTDENFGSKKNVANIFHPYADLAIKHEITDSREHNEFSEILKPFYKSTVLDTKKNFGPELNVKLNKCRRQKSAVSQLHEYALRLRMNIEFELIVDQTTKPHNRKYTMRCRVSSPNDHNVLNKIRSLNIVCEGEGSGKKAAKQVACQKVLDQLREIMEKDPLTLATALPNSVANHLKDNITYKNSASKLKDVKRKMIVKDLKMDPTYGQNINPISRLLQVAQIKNQRSEPCFYFVEENGHNRLKEFTIQVKCMGYTATGRGPSKKLAKRAAAEAMLEMIGYTKPMPQPTKSLLKKSSDAMHGSNDKALSSFNAAEKKVKLYTHSNDNFTNHSMKEIKNDFSNEDELCHSIPTDSDNLILKRRVTFSNDVIASPASDDESYPITTIIPLKSDISFTGKIKKRSRHSNVVLSFTEKNELAKALNTFIISLNNKNSGAFKSGLALVDTNDDDETLIFDESNFDSNLPILQQGTGIHLNIQPSHALNIQPMPVNTRIQPTLAFSMPPDFFPPEISPPLLHAPPPFLDYSNYTYSDFSPSVGDCRIMSSNHKSSVTNPYVQMTAKDFLEKLGHYFKFTVVYSDFPKAQDAATEEQCFSLVTLGLSLMTLGPIICHGSGATELEARNDAAFNALKKLLEFFSKD